MDLDEFRGALDQLGPGMEEVLRASWQEASSVFSRRGMATYLQGARDLELLGRGTDLVASYLQTAPAVARELGEEAVAELLADCLLAPGPRCPVPNLSWHVDGTMLGPRTRSRRHQWADGTRVVTSSEVEDRLRFALQVALLLREHDAARVVQAWFQGLNPHLEDRSPARMLREGDLGEVGPAVLAAARAFLIGG